MDSNLLGANCQKGQLKKKTWDQVFPNCKVAIISEEGSWKYDNRDETVRHLIDESETLAQCEYKKSHDRVVLIIHWELCALHGLKKNSITTEPCQFLRMQIQRYSGILIFKLTKPLRLKDQIL